MCSEQSKYLHSRQTSRYLGGQTNWQKETSLPLNSIQRKEVAGIYHINEKDSERFKKKKKEKWPRLYENIISKECKRVKAQV